MSASYPLRKKQHLQGMLRIRIVQGLSLYQTFVAVERLPRFSSLHDPVLKSSHERLDNVA